MLYNVHGKRRYRRRLEQRPQRKLYLQPLPELADQTRRQQRVTSKLEEIIPDADRANAKHFFPKGDQTAQLLQAAAVFAVGFVARPIGAWLMGLFADRSGRRTVRLIYAP